MPLLAAFIGNLAEALVKVFSKVLSYDLALKAASYGAWMAVIGVFLGSVVVCLTSLVGYLGSVSTGLGSSWARFFLMGLGMFIPSNAAAVMGCVASVWFACQLYKIQRDGIHNYSK